MNSLLLKKVISFCSVSFSWIKRTSLSIWRKSKWFVIVSVFISPIMVYCAHFWGYSISDEPADWASFGDYVGGVYSIIVTILVIFLTRSLDKKDEKQRNKANAAKELYDQITKIAENNNQNSISKLVRDINQSELFLPEGLVNQLRSLYDSFQLAHDGNGALDVDLKKRVLTRLKDIYNE